MFRFPGVQFSESYPDASERKHPAMSHSQIAMHFPLLPRTSVQVDFTGGALSSDGGLLLLALLDQRLGLTQRVAASLHDPRLPARTRHSLLDLIRQRVYQLAAGYEDANDATFLRHDPALKLAVGRAPLSDPDLASQPTLSRLEATLAESECDAINAVLLQQFLHTPRRKPRVVILDVDTSEHKTHGQQELALFNRHYGSTCYLPRFCFASVPGEPGQSLVAAELPDHHGEDTEAILAMLGRVVAALRQRWPGVWIRLRADAGFADPRLYTWCETNAVAYAIAMAGNPVLHAASQRLRQTAEKAAGASPTSSARLFGAVWYQAGSWEKGRTVLVKVEQTPTGQSTRYVVVWDLPGTARERYRFYGGRGDGENRIKELKEGIGSDRMSCREFASNKVRLMLASVAYVLLSQLRRVARPTELGRAQVGRLRLGLIKIGARIRESRRRVVVELCSSCPSQQTWRQLAYGLGVASG
jgi:hypothetical protein